MASVKRRAEAFWLETRKRWQINVQREGVRKTFTSSAVGKLGKHEAEAKADKWLKRFASEQNFGDAWAMFVADKAKGVQAHTMYSYQTSHNHISVVVPDGRKLSAITPYDWQQVLDKMVEGGAMASSTKRTLSVIMSFVAYCWSRRWEIEELRAGSLTVPETAKAPKQKKALNTEQVNKLLALSADDYKGLNLFKLAVFTGLRRGELLSLRWSDVDGGVLHVQGTKTVNAVRDVPLTAQALDLLHEQRARLIQLGRLTELVFPNETTNQEITPFSIQAWWAKVAAAIGADGVTIHELRHTFISMVKSDLPLAQLKQVVGHSASMDTYGVYGHQIDEDISRERDAMAGAFEKIKRVK